MQCVTLRNVIIRAGAMPPPLLVSLVNGWGTEPRRQAREQDLPYPPLATVLGRLDLPGVPESAVGDRQLKRLADALYPVFATPAPGDRVSLVNDLLERSRVRPAVGVSGDRVEELWVAPERDALLAAAAVCLRGQLAGHEPERLGTCAGVRCADAFVDASPGAHRRYCSITCQNRNRVAAFRRRRVAAKSVDQET
jgi:CGNR zinc finger protein